MDTEKSSPLHDTGCGCGTFDVPPRTSSPVLGTGVAAALPGAAFGQAPRATLIDTHHHFYPPPYQQAFIDWDDAQKLPHSPQQIAWTREKAVEAEMDKNGIRTAMLSLPSTRALVRRRAGAAARHGAHLQRLRRRNGARFSGPLRLVRAAVDAGHRHDAERDRIRIRHAQGRRRRAADQLWRQVAGPSRSSSRCWRSSTAARRWSTCIRWSRVAAEISASAHSRRSSRYRTTPRAPSRACC